MTAIDLITLDPAQSGDLALRGIRVTAHLGGFAERTTIEQTFANRGTAPLEPIYTFPIPDGAAVCGFEVITGDRVLTGVVDESDSIQEQYDAAVTRGDGAYLLERERDDVFSVRVGALKPGQVATLRITYVREVSVVERHLRFEFPTTIAPRYASGDGLDTLEALMEAQMEADAVNPPKAHAVPYGLTFALTVDLGRAARVSSPTHRVTCTELGRSRCEVTLADAPCRPDRSVVLEIALAGEDQPAARVERGPDGAQYVSVSFLPELPEVTTAPSADIVFLIDCSGSMAGESIQQARRALELCLRSLKHGDRFQVVRFGSTHVALTPEPVAYDAQTLAAALRDVRRIDADLGGTELSTCLRDVLGAPTRPGTTRQVLLLTDGQVSNEDATISVARAHASNHRIFSFGIGPAVSQALVHGLARVTRGVAEFVAYGERIEDKVLRTFSRLDAPRIEEVTLDFGGRAFELGSAELPPLFDGDALVVHARCAAELPTEAHLRFVTAGEPRAYTIALPAPSEGDLALPRLWAQQRIRALEDEVRGTPVASRFVRSRLDRSAAELVALSKTFNVVCSRTGFVAIEHRTLEERAQGIPTLTRIPVQLPLGWGGGSEGGVVPGAAPLMAKLSAMPSALPAPSAKRSFADRSRRALRSMLGHARAEELSDEACASETAAPVDGLFELLALQSADGDFAGLERVLPSERLAALRAAPLSADVDGRTRDTLIVLALLEDLHSDRRSAWRRAAQKARGWLCGQLGWDEPTLDAVVTELRAVS